MDFFLLLWNVFTHSQMFGGTVYPKVRCVCLSHERTRCVSQDDTTSKCFMYEMWSTSDLGPLICHPGTPIILSFFLSSGCLLFKCVLDLDLYPQGGSVASRASITFCVHVFLVVTVLGPDQTWYQPASVFWATCDYILLLAVWRVWFPCSTL